MVRVSSYARREGQLIFGVAPWIVTPVQNLHGPMRF